MEISRARAKCAKHGGLGYSPRLPQTQISHALGPHLEVLLRSACARWEPPDKAAEPVSCVGSEGWDRGNLTRLPRPVTSWSATALARPSFGSPRPYPTNCRLWVACSSRVVRSPVVFLVAALLWPPVRCAAGLVFFWGAVPREGRHLVSSDGLFASRHEMTLWQIGGDCKGPVRASAHLSRVLVGAGVTPAVHSHGPAPLAPAVTAYRSCAHGRVNSDRAADCPCSRLIRPQGPRPRVAAWRACPHMSRTVGCCWWHYSLVDSKRYGRRLRRLEDSSEDHPPEMYVPNARSHKRAATPRSSGQTVCCCTIHQRADPALFGLWVQTHSPSKFLASMDGP